MKDINTFRGLQRDTLNLVEGEYATLLNGVFDGVDEGTFTLSNEMSNVLSSKFKEGFKDNVKNLIEDSLNKVNDRFKLEIPFGCDVQFGSNYSQIH